MHIVRAFIGINGFQVNHVANHVVFIMNTVAAVHVARHAGNVKRLAARVALNQRNHFRHSLVFVHQTAYAQAGLQAQRDFGLHVGQLFLDQLGLCQWAAKLLAVHGVLAGTVPAVFSSTQSAPGNAVTRFVQATKRTLQARHIRQHVGFRHKHTIHHNFAGN